LNVGGHSISPANDKYGRIWEDDSRYVFGAAMGVTDSQNSNGSNITYSEANQADIFAPEDVYGTYRSMHPDSTINLQFNLTWIFSNIDANFSYLVRLHFCELQFTKQNQRVFDISINNLTAEQGFDVVAAASVPNCPIYKDYLVNVPAHESGKTDMWVALYPNKKTGPEYYNAILNGLEIFKLNDSSGNLAGPNPVVTEEAVEKPVNRPMSSSNGHKDSMFVAVSGSLAAAVSLLSLMIFCFVMKRRKKSIKSSREKPFTTAPVHGEVTTTSTSAGTSQEIADSSEFAGFYDRGLTSVAAIFCRHFSFAEIQDATNNFDDSHLLGSGGFGKVYRGEIPGGIRVAVKRANPRALQGSREFRNEINLLSRLRHKHLVSLIGFCDQNSEMCLVYDYVANGTLQKHLYGKNRSNNVLSWKQRLKICIDAAKGLDYLHSEAFQTVIHRDVKSTNILLDENLRAKVSDFGLSKNVATFDQSHVTTAVKGSYGYIDPQYFRRLAVTKKTDVYSFGVVLFEVLCAKPAVMQMPTQTGGKINLSDYVLENIREGVLEHIIDPSLTGDITSESLKKFAKVAEKCLAEEGDERPSMADVVWHLEFCLQLHETATAHGEAVYGDAV
ncbi:hypothetical protein KI387_012121, partial [Taxus chinensis]